MEYLGKRYQGLQRNSSDSGLKLRSKCLCDTGFCGEFGLCHPNLFAKLCNVPAYLNVQLTRRISRNRFSHTGTIFLFPKTA